jgi:acetyl/propionyl-CoA carboxylase alpha subunit
MFEGMARLMSQPVVTRIGSGMYRVDDGGRGEIVYVAGPPENRWAFWNGRVFHAPTQADRAASDRQRAHGTQSLTAPMPATVVKVLVKPGAVVKNGEVLIVLEAMKMELLIRAPADGHVAAVHCQEQDLVQPDAVLVELS